MLIIIEGPDGVGKTTLINQLNDNLSWPVCKFKQPEFNDTTESTIKMYKDTIDYHANAIFDRCWISEKIYAHALNRKPLLTTKDCISLEQYALRKGGYLYIYIEPSVEKRERYFFVAHKRGEDLITKYKTYQKVCDGYDSWYKVRQGRSNIVKMTSKVPV